MQRTQILDAVYDACEEVLQVDRSTLTEATHFADDLEADSLALVEVVMALEETFDLRIPEDDLDGVATIGAAADVVTSHLEAAA
jgi:acyl carrier protein